MATTDQMVVLLNEINGQLKQLNTTAKNRDVNNQKSKEKRVEKREEDAKIAQQKKFTTSIDKSIKSLSQLEKTASDAEKAFDKALGGGKIGTTIVSSLKKNLVPIYSQLKAGAKEFNDAVDDTVSKQEEYTKGISQATSNYIKSNYANVHAVKSTVNAYKDYMSVLSKVSQDQRKLSDDEIKILKGSLLQLQSSAKKSGINLDSMNKNQITILKKLQTGLEITTDELKELHKSLENTNKDFQAIHNVAQANYEEATKYAKQYQETVKQAMSSIGDTIKTGLLATIQQVYKDIKAQAQNAVGESAYYKAKDMGMSQEELSNFIGQNRMALRVLGGGKAATGITNEDVSNLQNEMHTFGVTGAEAAKVLGTNLTNSVKMGLVPSVTTATDQIKKMYLTMQESNLTFDQLNSLVSELSDSPAFLSLVQANGNTGQFDIIRQLMKLNTQAGYSTTYLKGIFESGQEKKYAGIEELVKGIVGVKLQAGNINRAMGQEYITQNDTALLSKIQSAGGMQGLVEQYKAGTAGSEIQDRFGSVSELQDAILKVSQKMSTGKVLATNKLTAGGNDLYRGLNNTLFSVSEGLMNNRSLTDRDAATAAISRRAGMGGIDITGPQDTLAGIKDIHNSALGGSVGKMLGATAANALNTGEFAEGLTKNALEMGTITVAKAFFTAAQVYFGGGPMKAMSAMGGSSAATTLGKSGMLKTGLKYGGTAVGAAGLGYAGYEGYNFMNDMDSSDESGAAEGDAAGGNNRQKTAATLAESFDNYTRKLEELITIQQKQTDVMVETHKEYMEYMKTVENNNKIAATRNNVRGALAAGGTN